MKEISMIQSIFEDSEKLIKELIEEGRLSDATVVQEITDYAKMLLNQQDLK